MWVSKWKEEQLCETLFSLQMGEHVLHVPPAGTIVCRRKETPEKDNYLGTYAHTPHLPVNARPYWARLS